MSHAAIPWCTQIAANTMTVATLSVIAVRE
jgi:hypothetical protein